MTKTYAGEIANQILKNPCLEMFKANYDAQAFNLTVWNHFDNRFYEIRIKPMYEIKEEKHGRTSETR